MGNDLNKVVMPIFTREEHAPAGHVALSSVWSSKESPRDRERVRAGVRARRIEASRLQATTAGPGTLWVHYEQAMKYLAAWDERHEPASRASGRRPAAELPLVMKPMEDLQPVLERIASALESLARSWGEKPLEQQTAE